MPPPRIHIIDSNLPGQPILCGTSLPRPRPEGRVTRVPHEATCQRCRNSAEVARVYRGVVHAGYGRIDHLPGWVELLREPPARLRRGTRNFGAPFINGPHYDPKWERVANTLDLVNFGMLVTWEAPGEDTVGGWIDQLSYGTNFLYVYQVGVANGMFGEETRQYAALRSQWELPDIRIGIEVDRFASDDEYTLSQGRLVPATETPQRMPRTKKTAKKKAKAKKKKVAKKTKAQIEAEAKAARASIYDKVLNDDLF